jgi:hypothetical protein
MAIQTGRIRQRKARREEGRRLAAEYAAQQAKESKRGFWSNIAGSVGGKILGAALGGALGIASGGLLMPLMAAAGSFGAKKLAHEATSGMGADLSKLKSQSKYGFGKEEAKTLREGLEAQQEASDPFKTQGGFGKALLREYVTAGVSGKLGGVKGALKKIGTGAKGGWGQALGVGKEYGTAGGWKGMAEGVGSLFGGETKETIAKDVPHADLDLTAAEEVASTTLPTGDLVSQDNPWLEGVTDVPTEMLGESTIDFPTTGYPEMVDPSIGTIPTLPISQNLPISTVGADSGFSSEWTQGDYSTYPTDVIDGIEYHINPATGDPVQTTQLSSSFQQGGLIPNKRPTISDYFGMQGISLGGSNKQSLAEMLGRK